MSSSCFVFHSHSGNYFRCRDILPYILLITIVILSCFSNSDSLFTIQIILPLPQLISKNLIKSLYGENHLKMELMNHCALFIEGNYNTLFHKILNAICFSPVLPKMTKSYMFDFVHMKKWKKHVSHLFLLIASFSSGTYFNTSHSRRNRYEPSSKMSTNNWTNEIVTVRHFSL